MLLRGALLLLGLSAAFCCTVAMPQYWLSAPIKDICTRALAGDRFTERTLNESLAVLRNSNRPLVERGDDVRSAALVLLWEAEKLAARNAEEADNSLEVAEGSLKSALALNPSDSFLWLMLYSVHVAQGGFDVQALDLLGRSYSTGPLEGWISLRRNRLAHAVFESLDGHVQELVVSEFRGMVNSNLLDAVVLSLKSTESVQQNRLIEGLADLDVISRETLAKRLIWEGMRLKVPGIELNSRYTR